MLNTRHKDSLEKGKIYLKQAMRVSVLAFEMTARWVSQLSWWKFGLFAILLLVSASIIQENFLSSADSHSHTSSNGVKNKKTVASHTEKKRHATGTAIEEEGIEFDANDIIIKSKDASKIIGQSSHQQQTKSSRHNTSSPYQTIVIDGDGERVLAEDEQDNDEDQTPPPPTNEATNTEKSPDEKQMRRVVKEPLVAPQISIEPDGDVRIQLPRELSREIRRSIERNTAEAAAEAAASATMDIQRKETRWFQSFILLLVFALFGMKALLGGKVKAEEIARSANESAENEALKRQVSEAKMQMMQAQVEPHFLFNTLASVEFLIETNPPRAAKMQKSLIAYLRAVIPQMREQASRTTLGREADMIKAYLDLIKMRMEERLHIVIDIPEDLRNAVFPPMMLQSLVENAIKHGLEVKEEGGTIQFKAEKAHNRIIVSVSDDGVGFGTVPSNGTGIGLQNIRERLKLLFKDNARIYITPNEPCGVKVSIEVPYEVA